MNNENELANLRQIVARQAVTIHNYQRELFSQKLLTDHHREALLWILAEPYGCRFCDSGKLRTDKDHDERCGFAKAQDLIGSKEH